MRSQVYLYLLIFILILLHILTVSPKESKISHNNKVTLITTIKEYPKGCWYSVDGFVLQIVGCQRFQAGSRLLIFGSVRKVSANQNSSSIFVDVTEVLPDYAQNTLVLKAIQKAQSALFNFRLKIYSRVREILLEPEAGLFFSLIFGGTSFLGPETKEKITQAGVNHLVSASGMNISLLFLLTSKLFSKLSRCFRSLLTLCLIIIYAHLAGLSISIIRAGLMGSASLLSALSFRKTIPIWNLFLSAMMILGLSPESLFDVSFQLSFTAVLGIFLSQNMSNKSAKGGVFSRLEAVELWSAMSTKKLSWFAQLLLAFKDSFFISLIVNLWIWPITAYHFNQVSLAGLFSSIFLSWLLLPIFALGGLVIILALLVPSGGVLTELLLIVGFPLHLLMRVFLLVTDFFSQFKVFNFTLEFDQRAWSIVWYLILLSTWFFLKVLKGRSWSQNFLHNYETLHCN